MEFSTMGFYAAVCGALAAAAPLFGAVWVRLATGVGVGVAASLVLPALRNMMAY